MFYNKNCGKINIGLNSFEGRKLAEAIRNGEGIRYRRKNAPEKIEILTEERTIPASPTSLFYSDGDAPDRVVPAGTILSSGKYVLKEEDLQEKYIPYEDENGNIVEGMYVRLEYVDVIKNPFGKTVVKVNDNEWICDEGDENCYIVADSMFNIYGFDIMTEEQLNSLYTACPNENNIKRR